MGGDICVPIFRLLCGMRLQTDVKLQDFLIPLFPMSLRIKSQAIKKEEYSIIERQL